MRLENEWKNRNEKELADVVGLQDAKAHIAILELNGYRLELFEYLNPFLGYQERCIQNLCFYQQYSPFLQQQLQFQLQII